MRQIIVMTNNREKIEGKFPNRYFYVIWCDISTDSLMKIRDRSDVIFICMDHEEHDELIRLGLYLKDICMEYEKSLYIFGCVDDVETVRAHVPELYIRNSRFAFTGIDPILEDLSGPDSGMTNPGILLIDDDMEYVELFREHLKESFNIYVSHFDPYECEYLARFSFGILMSTDGLIKLSYLIRILLLLNEKRKEENFHYYLIAPSDIERDALYEKTDKIGVTLSKEMDMGRIAKYLKNRIKPREENSNGD